MNCQNGGTCYNGECFCLPKYGGVLCEKGMLCMHISLYIKGEENNNNVLAEVELYYKHHFEHYLSYLFFYIH